MQNRIMQEARVLRDVSAKVPVLVSYWWCSRLSEFVAENNTNLSSYSSGGQKSEMRGMGLKIVLGLLLEVPRDNTFPVQILEVPGHCLLSLNPASLPPGTHLVIQDSPGLTTVPDC